MTGFSIAKAPSVAAWVKIHANRALAAAQLDDRMSAGDLISANYYLSICTADEQRAAVSQLAVQHRVAEADLTRVLTDFERRLSGNRTQGAATNGQRKLKRELITISGDHVDYSFRNKDLWRDAWTAFIDQNFPVALRPSARILCMPSKNPEREISRYLRLGFRAANIVGVEGGDAAAQQRFTAEANRLGFKPLLGRLEAKVHSAEAPFDLVLFDFIGPLCRAYLNIARDTPIKSTALVIVNYMDRREPNHHARFWEQRETERNPLLFQNAVVGATGGESAPSTPAAYSELKRNNMDFTFLQVLGDHIRPAAFPLGRLETEFRQRWAEIPADYRNNLGFRGCVASFSMPAFTSAAKLMALAFADSEPQFTGELFRLVQGFLSLSVFRFPLCERISRYQYRSQASGNSAHFLSSMAVVRHLNDDIFYTVRHTTRFLLDSALPMVNQVISDQGVFNAELILKRDWSFRVLDKHCQEKLNPREIAKGDLIVCELDGRRVAEIRASKFWDDVQLLNNEVSRCCPAANTPYHLVQRTTLG